MKYIKNIIGKLCLRIKTIAESYEANDYKSRLAACGKEVTIGKGCHLIPENIFIGDYVTIGEKSYIMSTLSKIYIGNHVITGPGVVIRGGDHRIDVVGKYINEIKENEKLPENDKDIFIGNDVWIGQNAIILKGVHIGEGCVIGAGAIVTKDIPPYSIYVGSHSPFCKERFTKNQILEHKRLLNNDFLKGIIKK